MRFPQFRPPRPNGVTINFGRTSRGRSAMRASEKEKLEEAAVTGVGAGVGGAGGATVGVLELAATQGTVTGLSAGVVLCGGGLAGAGTFLLGYKIYRAFTK